MLPQSRTALALIAGGAASYVLYRLYRKRAAALSAAQREYLAAFDARHAHEPFVRVYTVGGNKSLQSKAYTRGEFLTLALQACRVLRDASVGPGEAHTHFFSCNTLGDLAFRLASVLCGTVPVTINWQADTPDRVLYKVTLTASKLVLHDEGTPKDVLALLASQQPTVVAFDVAKLPEQPPLAP